MTTNCKKVTEHQINSVASDFKKLVDEIGLDIIDVIQFLWHELPKKEVNCSVARQILEKAGLKEHAINTIAKIVIPFINQRWH